MTSTLTVTTPSECEIRVSRKFDAPHALVFDFHTKPEYVKRWLLGPPGWTMPVCEIDLSVGGKYRYRWRSDADGREFGVQGQFLEVVSPERIVNIETMEGMPGETTVTMTFEDSDGGTLLTVNMLFDSRQTRDIALETGMTDGMAMSYDRLQEDLNSHRA